MIFFVARPTEFVAFIPHSKKAHNRTREVIYWANVNTGGRYTTARCKQKDMAADESTGLAAARVFFAQNEKSKELQVCVPKA